MPFSLEFLQNASKEVVVSTVEKDLEIVKGYINKAIEKAAKEMPYVRPKNVEIYLHGSYANKTNIFFPSNLEVCVEIRKTAEYEPDKITVQTPNKETGETPIKVEPTYHLYNNYYVEHNLEFSPKDFRDLLFEKLGEVTDQKCQIHDKVIVIPAFGKLKHIVEITPCFTFDYYDDIPNMEGGVELSAKAPMFKGVLLYDASVGADIITFPKLHAQNGNAKDLACKGNFKKFVRMFKTMNAIANREQESEDKERGYFIECLLFNVPNQIYSGKNLSDAFIKVINYLANCDMDGFVCQNLIWQLFGSAVEFWNLSRAEQFVKLIMDLYKTFPPKRTLLA